MAATVFFVQNHFKHSLLLFFYSAYGTIMDVQRCCGRQEAGWVTRVRICMRVFQAGYLYGKSFV